MSSRSTWERPFRCGCLPVSTCATYGCPGARRPTAAFHGPTATRSSRCPIACAPPAGDTRGDDAMTNGRIHAVAAGVALLAIAFCAGAQPAPAPQPGYAGPPPYAPPGNPGTQTTLIQVPSPQPVITITASASSEVANDRMLAMLRAETDNADAGRAASEVNARMARALSQAKSVSGVDARTMGYSSYQISEPNRPLRWRVSQSLALESSDFVALSALVSKLQGGEGLVLSGLSFSVSPQARRAAEDALTTQAIHNWQQ